VGKPVPKGRTGCIVWSGPYERNVFGGLCSYFGRAVGCALDCVADYGGWVEFAKSWHGNDTIFDSVELVTGIDCVLRESIQLACRGVIVCVIMLTITYELCEHISILPRTFINICGQNSAGINLSQLIAGEPARIPSY